MCTSSRHKRTHAEPTHALAVAAATGAALALLSGCAQVLGIDELSPGAGAGRVTLRGTASGVLAPVSLRLTHPGGSEELRVDGDGAFGFSTELSKGDIYEVAIAAAEDAQPCALDHAAGTADSDADESQRGLELACGPTLLTELSIADVDALPFELGRADYDLSVPLLQRSLQITAAAAHPDAELRIDGTPVAAGTPGPPIALPLGASEIVLELGLAGGSARSYRLHVAREAAALQRAYGKAENGDGEDAFGFSMDLAGELLVVGAPYEDSAAREVDGDGDSDAASDSGAVYIFRRDGESWVEEAYLKPRNGAAGDNFGHSLAISGDTLAIGAPFEDSAARGSFADSGAATDDDAGDSGAVYIFVRDGGRWREDAYLKAHNGDPADNFGWAVDLDGDTLAVGARFESGGTTGVGGGSDGLDDERVGKSGAVYVFHRDGGWQQEAYVKASNTGREDNFGRSLSLDGDTLAVGARFEDSDGAGVDGAQDNDARVNSGAVYVFRLARGRWAQEAYLKASNPAFEDNFGLSLALAGDLLAVSAPYEDSAATGVDGDQGDDSAEDSGAVYLFERSDSTWKQAVYLKASNSGQGDNFGWSLDAAGDLVAIGALGESGVDDGSPQSGATYLLGRDERGWREFDLLRASNAEEYDWFGYAVALGEGRLVVSARDEDSASQGWDGEQTNNSAANSGAVYGYE